MGEPTGAFHTGKGARSSLKGEAIRRLDAVVLTHSDADHIGSLRHLLEEMAVDRLYFGKGSEQGEELQALLLQAGQKGTEAEPILAPAHIREGAFLLEVLWPERASRGTNEDSLVVFASIGNLHWLFTGDATEREEAQLVRAYPSLAVDVLKVGHHGSATSTSEVLLEQLAPSLAVLSVGRHNTYGHPDPEVMERLERRSTHVFRTDKHGAVHYAYRKGSGEWFHVLQ